MPAWRSTERVCTLPHCKLSRAGNLRLSQPLSLPGGQRGFALCPLANFPEQSGMPALCPAIVPAWRNTERVCTPPHCKLSRAGSPRLAIPLQTYRPRLHRRQEVSSAELLQSSHTPAAWSPIFIRMRMRMRSRSTIPGPAAQSPGSLAFPAAVNAHAHLLPASARPPTNVHIQTPSPLSFIKIKDRK